MLHEIERAAIEALDGAERGMGEADLAGAAGLSPDQTRRGIEWLRHKGLADVGESSEAIVSLGPAGRGASEAAGEKGGGAEGALPERHLLEMLAGAGGRGMEAGRLQAAMGSDFGPAMGIARRAGWARAGPGGRVELAGGRGGADKLVSLYEGLLKRIGRAGESGIAAAGLSGAEAEALASLRRRPGYVVERVSKSRTVRLTAEGREAASGLKQGGTGGGKAAGTAGAIDVEAAVPAALPARLHPLTETIEAVRDAFVALGFSEIVGPHVQPGFWNFDALFTPQDHPAREMQDTFYVAGARGEARPARYGRIPAAAAHARAVAGAHARGWGYGWSAAESRKAVLRTHTTCVTARHLAESRPERARIFSLGRVFRNEKASYKHLSEFHQVEGVVVGPGADMRSLMGILERFYSMIGVDRVKFWPTYFPYTEPSLQAMAYNEGHGRWVELFGMGMLRREVTEPLGMGDVPVLAWGGGIERIAMMRYGVDDVRRFYGNDLGWLRGAAACP